MDIEIEICERLPSREELDPMLGQYYALVVRRMTDMGFEMDAATPQGALAEFWEHAEDYLPPEGCLVIARHRSGRIVGCGMLRRFDARTGELKRMFVADEARGTGTGRALVEAREDAARQMGLTRLVADTLTPNVEMRSLYPKLGFVELETPIETPIETVIWRDQPELRAYMHFFAKEI